MLAPRAPTTRRAARRALTGVSLGHALWPELAGAAVAATVIVTTTAVIAAAALMAAAALETARPALSPARFEGLLLVDAWDVARAGLGAGISTGIN